MSGGGKRVANLGSREFEIRENSRSHEAEIPAAVAWSVEFCEFHVLSVTFV